jgi:protein TonB
MFEQSILRGTPSKRRAWAMSLSVAGQIAGVGVAILIPLLAYDHLPQTKLVLRPLMAPPAPPAKSEAPPHVRIVAVQWQSRGKQLVAPGPMIPPHPTIIIDNMTPPPDPGSGGVDTGVAGGISGTGDPDGVIGGLQRLVAANRLPPKEPPQAVKPVVEKPPQRITVSSVLVQASLIRKVTPVYPPLAKQAHVQGVVRLQAVIASTGQIQQLSVVSGSPLLIQAALDAVRQWEYRPTMLNGSPVEVLTTVDVIFTLNN